MIYDMSNTFDVGRYVDKVIDANGFEHQNKQIISVDTATGEIIQYKLNENGMVVEDGNKGILLQETVKIAAPVLVIFKEGNR